MERHELIKGLRAIADFYEHVPENFPMPFWDGINTFPNKQDAPIIIKVLGRSDKKYFGDFVVLTKSLGSMSLNFLFDKREVCERIVIGIKDIPEKIIPAHEEDVVEWKCGPLLDGEQI